MPYTVSGKIRNITRYDVFWVIVVYSFQITEFAVYGFGCRKQITYLYIYAFFPFVSNKINLVIIGFSDFYVVAAGKQFKIYYVFI